MDDVSGFVKQPVFQIAEGMALADCLRTSQHGRPVLRMHKVGEWPLSQFRGLVAQDGLGGLTNFEKPHFAVKSADQSLSEAMVQNLKRLVCVIYLSVLARCLSHQS